MARTKSTPLKREASSDWIDHRRLPESATRKRLPVAEKLEENGILNGHIKGVPIKSKLREAGLTELVICAVGIYASFLTWAFLQERITTTPYGSASSPEVFNFSIFLNTVQSSFAALVGYIYLAFSSRGASAVPPIFPSRAIFLPLLLVAITQSLASPFGYASLKHVGYITFILAKSCKLLPVMALHVSIFRKRYPLYKYAVVTLVTSGVAIFTLQHSPSSKKSSSRSEDASTVWGLVLLSINLLFDGLTNSTQDHINAAFKPYSGSQMMCAQNLISTVLTSLYLVALPYLAATSFGPVLNLTRNSAATAELTNALAFISRHPEVGYDVLGFAACGAVGQIFIFYTLSKFSSLLLVTITVTRKMLTMLLSVVMFGHRLTGMQWLGVALVFGGVGAEGIITRREKVKKEQERTASKVE